MMNCADPPWGHPAARSAEGGGEKVQRRRANHWKRWDAKPEAKVPLAQCSFGYRTLCVRSFCKERKFAMKNKREWKSLKRRGLAALLT